MTSGLRPPNAAAMATSACADWLPGSSKPPAPSLLNTPVPQTTPTTASSSAAASTTLRRRMMKPAHRISMRVFLSLLCLLLDCNRSVRGPARARVAQYGGHEESRDDGGGQRDRRADGERRPEGARGGVSRDQRRPGDAGQHRHPGGAAELVERVDQGAAQPALGGPG